MLVSVILPCRAVFGRLDGGQPHPWQCGSSDNTAAMHVGVGTWALTSELLQTYLVFEELLQLLINPDFG